MESKSIEITVVLAATGNVSETDFSRVFLKIPNLAEIKVMKIADDGTFQELDVKIVGFETTSAYEVESGVNIRR